MEQEYSITLALYKMALEALENPLIKYAEILLVCVAIGKAVGPIF